MFFKAIRFTKYIGMYPVWHILRKMSIPEGRCPGRICTKKQEKEKVYP